MMTRLKLGILQPDGDCPYNHIQGNPLSAAMPHTAIANKPHWKVWFYWRTTAYYLWIRNIRTLFVAGPGASDAFYLMGNYFGLSNRYCTYLQVSYQRSATAPVSTTVPIYADYQNELNNMELGGQRIQWIGSRHYRYRQQRQHGGWREAIASSSRGDRVGISLPESSDELSA